MTFMYQELQLEPKSLLFEDVGKPGKEGSGKENQTTKYTIIL